MKKLARVACVSALALGGLLRAATAHASIVSADYIYTGTGDFTFTTNCPACVQPPPLILPADGAEVKIANDVITYLSIGGVPAYLPVSGGIGGFSGSLAPGFGSIGGGLTLDAAGTTVTDWNLFYGLVGGCCTFQGASFTPSGDTVTYGISAFGGGVETWTAPPGTWSVEDLVITPLPAALPLFATGLGGIGLLGWRRKRKA